MRSSSRSAATRPACPACEVEGHSKGGVCADVPQWSGAWPPSGALDVQLKLLCSDACLRPLLHRLLPAGTPQDAGLPLSGPPGSPWQPASTSPSPQAGLCYCQVLMLDRPLAICQECTMQLHRLLPAGTPQAADLSLSGPSGSVWQPASTGLSQPRARMECFLRPS